MKGNVGVGSQTKARGTSAKGESKRGGRKSVETGNAGRGQACLGQAGQKLGGLLSCSLPMSLQRGTLDEDRES